jgi:NRPS condensation-like uncharacterized protein
MLLTSYLRTISAISGDNKKAALRVLMTVDLRLWYLKKNHGGNVSNLSSFEYVNIGTQTGCSFDETLMRVSRYTRKRKKNWYGLNQLVMINYMYRLFDYSSWMTFWKTAVAFGTGINNLPHGLSNFGIIDKEKVVFETHPVRAFIMPPVLTPPAFALCASGYDGTLAISAGIYGDNPLVNAVLDGMTGELSSLDNSPRE